MLKKPSLLALLALTAASVPDDADAVLGSNARACAAGGPAMLVRVTGLKNRVGKVRVRTFAGPPATWFNKQNVKTWAEYPLPQSGPVEICVPERPGSYAVDIRHDANRNAKTDLSDGAGVSGNPKLTALDVLFKRRPPADQVRVTVGRGVTVVPITVRYR